MNERYEMKMELNLTERELIVLANNSLAEARAQLDRVDGAVAQIEAGEVNSHYVDVAQELIHEDVIFEINELSRYLTAIESFDKEKKEIK